MPETIDELQVIEDLVAIIDNLVDAWEIKLIPQDYIIVDRARKMITAPLPESAGQ